MDLEEFFKAKKYEKEMKEKILKMEESRMPSLVICKLEMSVNQCQFSSLISKIFFLPGSSFVQKNEKFQRHQINLKEIA